MGNKASIDIGSNSCILLILDKNNEVLFEDSRITALGKNLDDQQMFHEDSMKDTYEALVDYSKICSDHGIMQAGVVMTATEASRVAKNADTFYQMIEESLGLKVRLISGKEEAYYTAMGVSRMSKIDFERFVIMDIGGASTELIDITNNPFSITNSVSLPVGSVRATDWLANETFLNKIENILSQEDKEKYSHLPIICVAGTMTSIALMLNSKNSFDMNLINNTEVSLDQYMNKIEDLLQQDEESLKSSYPFLGKRLASIKGGIEVSSNLFEKLKPSRIYFSTYGLRYGTILSGDF